MRRYMYFQNIEEKENIYHEFVLSCGIAKPRMVWLAERIAEGELDPDDVLKGTIREAPEKAVRKVKRLLREMKRLRSKEKIVAVLKKFGVTSSVITEIAEEFKKKLSDIG